MYVQLIFGCLHSRPVFMTKQWHILAKQKHVCQILLHVHATYQSNNKTNIINSTQKCMRKKHKTSTPHYTKNKMPRQQYQRNILKWRISR